MEIFRTLRRYRILRSTYLHGFVGGTSEKRFIERLGDLFHEGYLDRPNEQWRFADARYRPVVYELGRGGVEAAGIATEAESVTWFRHGPHRQFEHTLMVCEVLASIELTTRGRPDIRFISWPEILAKAPEATRQSAKPYLLSADNGETVIPDAFFGLEYRHDGRKAYRFFALEADRGTMPIARSMNGTSSVLAKLRYYRELIKRDAHKLCLGIPNLLILLVTTNFGRCSEITTNFHRVAGACPEFLIGTAGDPTLRNQPVSDLLHMAWHRPGVEPIILDL